MPPAWRARPLYLDLPGIGWPSYTPRHLVPFSSSSTTRRATVEIFESAFTWGLTAIHVFITTAIQILETRLCGTEIIGKYAIKL
jgi:hypothetical protein